MYAYRFTHEASMPSHYDFFTCLRSRTLYFVKTRLSYANEWSSWCSVHVSSILYNKLPNATIVATISIL